MEFLEEQQNTESGEWTVDIKACELRKLKFFLPNETLTCLYKNCVLFCYPDYKFRLNSIISTTSSKSRLI
jgi:hypothetical protein